MADGLPADDFWAIEVGPNGDLWAVGQDDLIEGVGITHFDGARWTTYTRADGLMDDIAFDVAIDHEGTVWVATLAGVSEFHPGLAPAPSPTPGGPCVCQLARQVAPPAMLALLAAALANPGSVAGWRQPLDPNKPVSRCNPLRECLTLAQQAVPYHPLYNPLSWRVGCPLTGSASHGRRGRRNLLHARRCLGRCDAT